ncbi:MAG: GNAT family N-acetyltransferase, partial [Kiloniellaceae bacterium]
MSAGEPLIARNDEIAGLLQRLGGGLPAVHPLAEPRWLDILGRAYGAERVLFAARDAEGRSLGQLPTYYSRRGGSLFGLRYGLAAGDAAAAGDLLAAARRFAAGAGLSRLDIGLARAGRPPGAGALTAAAGFHFDLAGCAAAEAVSSLLSRHGRRALRTAEAAGQEIRGGPDQLSAAYAIYAGAMREKGVRVHSRAFVEAVAAAFGADFVPLVAFDGGQPVAATFLLLGRDVGLYLYGGGTPRGLQLQSGSLLYAEMMRHCIARGRTTFDAGESSPGGGTFEFKRRLGARQVAIAYLREAVAPPPGLAGRLARAARRAG